MLGEMIAREVMQIEHEKTCECVYCGVNGAVRHANIFIAKTRGCGCPVCQTCCEKISRQARRTVDLLHQHHALEEEIESERCTSEIIITPFNIDPAHQEKLGTAIQSFGALKALSMALNANVKNYREICAAAHEAYGTVVNTASTAFKDVLTKGLANAAVLLIDHHGSKQNPNDVN